MAMLPNNQVPMCAKCGRPVDNFVRVDNYNGLDILFEAHCHGEVQKVILPHWVMANAGPNGIQLATAFADDPALTNAAPAIPHADSEGGCHD